MKNIIFIGAFLFAATLFSQNQGAIKGSITDKAMNNEPVLMANVQIKGDDTITQTNFHGNYEISNLEPGAYTLVISYLGYEAKEVAVIIEENMIAKIDAQLSPIQISFGDVVGMNSALKEDTEQTSTLEKSLRK